MNIAICDDEAAVRRQLYELAVMEDDVAGIDEFSTAEELLATDKNYNLVFLDIIMPGISGIEAARSLRAQDKNLCIVFVTGAKDYVFDAFDIGALNYLLKPINPQKFKEVFCKAYEEDRRRKQLQDTIVVRTRKSTQTVKLCDIFYAESQLKKLIIHTADSAIAYYGRISELEEKVGDGFYRCHRGYLVNFSHIVRYNSESITLSNGEQVYLAKERYADFVQRYLKFIKNGGAIIV